MKSKVALICLGLASASFALDEYLPLAKGVAEVDVGVSPIIGENTTNTGLPVLQFKYGVIDGLDIEVAATYFVGDVAGLGQPEVAAKYAIGTTGFAPYLNLVLPIASGDRDIPGTGLGIAPGVVYGKNYDKISAVAQASYQINLEDDGVTPDNILGIYLKPGYIANDKLTGYVGFDYKMQGDNTAFTLKPGVTYMQSAKLSWEVNLPIALADDINGQTSWGVSAAAYFTL